MQCFFASVNHDGYACVIFITMIFKVGLQSSEGHQDGQRLLDTGGLKCFQKTEKSQFGPNFRLLSCHYVEYQLLCSQRETTPVHIKHFWDFVASSTNSHYEHTWDTFSGIQNMFRSEKTPMTPLAVLQG